MEHQGNHASFLDLDITIIDGTFVYKLYDKRDQFPFSIVRLPFASSNIPTNMFYSCIGAEILRIGRVCSSNENFIHSCKALISRVKRQGATDYKFSKILKKTYGRQHILRRFSTNATQFTNSILL